MDGDELTYNTNGVKRYKRSLIICCIVSCLIYDFFRCYRCAIVILHGKVERTLRQLNAWSESGCLNLVILIVLYVTGYKLFHVGRQNNSIINPSKWLNVLLKPWSQLKIQLFLTYNINLHIKIAFRTTLVPHDVQS